MKNHDECHVQTMTMEHAAVHAKADINPFEILSKSNLSCIVVFCVPRVEG